MKKRVLFSLLVSSLALISCSNENNNNNNIKNNENKDEAIVVYFSATSNTERVATTIASYKDLSIYELEPVTPYTNEDLNYNNPNSRVSKEHNDINRSVSLITTKFEKFDDSKYIFLGAPVWWGELSWVINDFLINNDFSNKTIIPFGTSASSSFNIDNIKDLVNETTWLTGQRFSSRVNENEVISWVDSLNLNI